MSQRLYDLVNSDRVYQQNDKLQDGQTFLSLSLLQVTFLLYQLETHLGILEWITKLKHLSTAFEDPKMRNYIAVMDLNSYDIKAMAEGRATKEAVKNVTVNFEF